jgi:hypothetical protein
MSLWTRLLRKLWRRLEPEPVAAASQPKPERTLAEITDRHDAAALSQEERDRVGRARLLKEASAEASERQRLIEQARLLKEEIARRRIPTVNLEIDVETNRLTGEMWQYTEDGQRKPVDPGVRLAIRPPE